jgi:hypothetical protein
MGELAARAEVIKLAYELASDPGDFAFLQAAPEDEVALLRATLSRALFAAHEPRLRRLANLSRLLPPPLAAKIAESALGPMLCGRVAGVLDMAGAIRLAGHLHPSFLAKVSHSLDPERTADIVRSLPEDLVLAVAAHLLDAGDYIVLGRFVAIVSDSVTSRVIGTASGEQLLRIGFYTEDRSRLDQLLSHIDDARLAEVIQAAADTDQFDEALSLIVFLGPLSQQRLSDVLTVLDPSIADGVVAAVVRLGAWAELLPVVGRLSKLAMRLLVNVPTTRDPAVISGLIGQVREQSELVDTARELGYFAMIVEVIEALDDAHRAVLSQVGELDDPSLQAWAARLVGVSTATVEQAVAAFRSGDPLPPELVDALANAGSAHSDRSDHGESRGRQ